MTFRRAVHTMWDDMGVGEDTGTCAETTSVPLVDCTVLVVVEGEVIPETSWLEVGAAVARRGGVDRNSGRYNPEDMRGREGEGMGSRIGEYAKVISSASEDESSRPSTSSSEEESSKILTSLFFA